MRRALRLPALIVLPLLLVTGLVIEASTEGAREATVRVSELTPTAAAPGTPSSTWYCAAGSATGVTSGEGAGPAEQRVIVANASDADVTGVATIYPEGGEPRAVPIQAGAHSQTSLEVSAQVSAPWAAVLVETTGGEVTVAHELSGPTGRSVSDCASSPSADWYFPGGTTRVGTTMWIALFNPFPGEATVDMAFETENGARTAQDFQGIVVPGGSVVVKDVSEKVTLAEQASATVSTRSGRIIAEQVQSFEGREGSVKGLTATIGATTPASIWSFPTSAPADVAGAESVAVFNPGETDTDVLVQVQLDDPAANGTVEPFEVTVPAHRYAVVAVSDDARVPPGVPHWIIVRAPDGSDVVAQRLLTGGSAGISTTVGLPVVATSWLAPVATADDVATSLVAIANPSATDTATVTLRRQGQGTVADVAEVVDLEIAPGEWTVVDLLAAGFTAGSSVEVVADVPVVVGQWMSFSGPAGIATPLGVPVAGTQSVPEAVVGPTVVTDEGLGTDDLAPAPPVADPNATSDTSAPAADTGSSTTAPASSTTAGG